MTNYLAPLAASIVFLGGTASAAEKPAPTAAANTVPHYTQVPAASTLTFSFEQAGAQSKGSFRRFTTEFSYDEKNLAASSLKVTVQVNSLDTQDKDRDEALAGADLFDTKQFPLATYTASSLAKGAGGALEAIGKLTLRGVTRDLRVPLSIRPFSGGLELSGEVTLKRLDYGVGQGEWKSTEWVGDEVRLQYKVALSKAAK